MYWEKVNTGMFSFGSFYTKMVEKFDNAVFVEIGCWKGQSTLFMAEKIKELKKNIKFFAIDVFNKTSQCSFLWEEGLDVFKVYSENIEPMKDFIITIVGSSHEVYDRFEDQSIDFLFIDGEHSYEAVKMDLNFWYPKIKIGGIISGHDYIWKDQSVKRAVDEYFKTGVKLETGDSWYYEKIR